MPSIPNEATQGYYNIVHFIFNSHSNNLHHLPFSLLPHTNVFIELSTAPQDLFPFQWCPVQSPLVYTLNWHLLFQSVSPYTYQYWTLLHVIGELFLELFKINFAFQHPDLHDATLKLNHYPAQPNFTSFPPASPSPHYFFFSPSNSNLSLLLSLPRTPNDLLQQSSDLNPGLTDASLKF